jgi:lysophospholipase L1-like esterase
MFLWGKEGPMRTRLLAVLVAALAAVIGGVPASATSPQFNPPKQFYLSLGDSVAFGYQNDKFFSELVGGTFSPSNFPGYSYPFGADMQQLRPGLHVADFGCPGETTVSYMGTCAFQAAGLALHDGYSGESQMQAALNFLRAHHGQVSPITISLGANDVQSCLPAADPTCIATEIATVGTNMTTILGALRAAAPNAEIIALQYYNPLFVVNPATDPFARELNSAIGAAAASADGRVANAFAVINAPPEATNVCIYTLMCPGVYTPEGGDIHPSDPGYAVITGVFWNSSGYARLTS